MESQEKVERRGFDGRIVHRGPFAAHGDEGRALPIDLVDVERDELVDTEPERK
jgi:hypothetical protein